MGSQGSRQNSRKKGWVRSFNPGFRPVQNQPIEPEQIGHAVGTDLLSELAAKAGHFRRGAEEEARGISASGDRQADPGRARFRPEPSADAPRARPGAASRLLLPPLRSAGRQVPSGSIPTDDTHPSEQIDPPASRSCGPTPTLGSRASESDHWHFGEKLDLTRLSASRSAPAPADASNRTRHRACRASASTRLSRDSLVSARIMESGPSRPWRKHRPRTPRGATGSSSAARAGARPDPPR